ncbi:MAG: hypothetical protein IAI50_14200, partial [Candidatus Eremiobacteraeota bacterium]|nr:hypothetical protein [Candidatus Eremiobacteraeota bacterium]
MNLFSTWTTRGFGALKNGGRAFALGSIFILTTVIALPRASEARIVYTYLNETCTTPVPGSCFVGINLNGARTDDFYLQSSVSYVNCPKHGGRYLRSFVRITPVASPGVVEENGFAAALNAGRRIGTGQTFGGELYLGISIEPHGCQINSTDGDWLGTGNHYLGLTINP